MASQQDDTVLPEEDQDQDLDDDEESSEDDDLEENDDVLVENDEEEDDDEEEDLNSASTTTPTPAITVAFSSASAITVPPASVVTFALPPGGNDDPDPKRQRIEENNNLIVQEEKKPQQLDESRRLFQRLWTDEDEIGLLQGFLDYTTQRGNAHHHDTALFYDQIKSKLQLDFNKNQLVEKLRRLKKKYRNVVSKISSGKDFSFKTAHDQATFEISRKIWSSNNTTNVNVLDDEDANANQNHGNHFNFSNEIKPSIITCNNHEEKNTPKSRKRSRSKPGTNENAVLMSNSENVNVNVNTAATVGGIGNGIAGVVEETVRSCLSPLFKDLLSNVIGGVSGRGIGGLTMNAAMPLGFGAPGLGFGGAGVGDVVDDKWRKQQILELEVYLKRLELVQDQIKLALEDLRSMGS